MENSCAWFQNKGWKWWGSFARGIRDSCSWGWFLRRAWVWFSIIYDDPLWHFFDKGPFPSLTISVWQVLGNTCFTQNLLPTCIQLKIYTPSTNIDSYMQQDSFILRVGFVCFFNSLVIWKLAGKYKKL